MAGKTILTPKQEKFAQNIASGNFLNNWEAYQNAYPNFKGSRDTLYQAASRLQSDSKIYTRIFELRDKASKSSVISLIEILEMLTSLIKVDTREMFNSDGTMKEITELTYEQAKALSSFDVVEQFAGRGDERHQSGVLRKIKLVDLRAIADIFMKHFGAYITKMEVKVEDINHIKDLLDGIEE